MVQSMISCISAGLEGISDGCAVYTEEPEQGTLGPCFFIFCQESAQRRLHGNRTLRSCLFEIQYNPREETQFQGEADQISEQLYEKLDFLPLETGGVSAVEMSCEKRAKKLYFHARYETVLARPEEPEPFMEELRREQRLRG